MYEILKEGFSEGTDMLKIFIKSDFGKRERICAGLSEQQNISGLRAQLEVVSILQQLDYLFHFSGKKGYSYVYHTYSGLASDFSGDTLKELRYALNDRNFTRVRTSLDKLNSSAVPATLKSIKSEVMLAVSTFYNEILQNFEQSMSSNIDKKKKNTSSLRKILTV